MLPLPGIRKRSPKRNLHCAANPVHEWRTGTALPGYGKPIMAGTSDVHFSNALLEKNLENDSQPALLTAREYRMMEMMDRMSDIHQWESKVFDESITAKWKAEFMADTDVDISEKMFEECLAELKYKTKLFETTNSVEALNGVFKSDTIIPEDVRLALIEAVKPLEDVPEDQKDWHPGSDGKVLDLVHPSIYPLVYGQTAILPNEYTSLENWPRFFSVGDELQANQEIPKSDRSEWSNRFQWLPAEVDISNDETKFVSYINNLHPQKHQRLYSVIEQVLEKSILLWNQTLSRLVNHRAPRIELDHNGYGEAKEAEPQYPEGSDWDADAFTEKRRAWQDSRPIVQPEPNPFKPDGDGEEGIPYNLRSTRNVPEGRIQVIVKLASIYLTPDSPNYEGGSWHVEGAANEAICASAIYYYESDNISESFLSFQHSVEGADQIDNYEQDDHRAIETIYGIKNGHAAIQNLGYVRTEQSRLVAFPNIMLHCVSPFKLEDPSKPGHRKILALFLVDPHQPIISTANVPPQQAEWWQEHIRLVDQIQSDLPQELSDHVMKDLRLPVSMEVAKQQRLELMQERGGLAEERDRSMYEAPWRGFSLCEH